MYTLQSASLLLDCALLISGTFLYYFFHIHNLSLTNDIHLITSYTSTRLHHTFNPASLRGHDGELVGAAVLGGVLHGHLHDLSGHGRGVASGHLGDDLHGLLQSRRALLQGHQELLLALLVREQLLVVAHTHAHQALAELITVRSERI